MSETTAKKYEAIIKDSFKKIPDTYVLRLYDTTSGYLNIKNPCDFIVYHDTTMYLVECKTLQGTCLNKSSISQLNDLLDAAEVTGICSGVLVWYRDFQKTFWVNNIYLRYNFLYNNKKSLNIKDLMSASVADGVIEIPAKVKRTFCDYDLEVIFECQK